VLSHGLVWFARDDFNPSIGISDASGGCRLWLNWASTDVAAQRPQTSAAVTAVPCGVSDLIGTDLTVRAGTTTSTNFRFGDYSSVAIDPVGKGKSAVVAQEYFTGDTNWSTNIAEITF
jgi:hypothetical protein